MGDNKNAVLISDLFTDEHVLITRADFDYIQSGLLSLSAECDEMGEAELARRIMKIWHKIYMFKQGVRRTEDVLFNNQTIEEK